MNQHSRIESVNNKPEFIRKKSISTISITSVNAGPPTKTKNLKSNKQSSVSINEKNKKKVVLFDGTCERAYCNAYQIHVHEIVGKTSDKKQNKVNKSFNY
jgi:hypothetical protein